MKISPKDLVRLIVEADKQGYNLAVKRSDLAYDEYVADFRKALNEERTKTEQAFDRGFKAAQADYQAGLSQGLRDALSDEALADAKRKAYDQGKADGKAIGYAEGYDEGYDVCANDHDLVLNTGRTMRGSDEYNAAMSRATNYSPDKI